MQSQGELQHMFVPNEFIYVQEEEGFMVYNWYMSFKIYTVNIIMVILRAGTAVLPGKY